MTYEALALFPTVVQTSDLDRSFTQEELDFIGGLTVIPNMLNLQSKNTYVLDNPRLSNLKEKLLEGLQVYLYNILKATPDVQIYITQSWVNCTKELEAHHRHAHNNSFLSGVVYIDANSEKDEIIFFKDRCNQIAVPTSEWNMFNSETWRVTAETGKIVIFPSSLNHAVEVKQGTNTRISLAFNSFIKGNLGNEEDLTKLVLG